MLRKLSFYLFLASLLMVFGCKISGTITEGGVGLGGVTLTLSGAASGTTTTNANGLYTFDNLLSLGSYCVTPSMDGYTFNPENKSVNITLENMEVSGIDFVATVDGGCTDTWVEKMMGQWDSNEDELITIDEVQALQTAKFNQMDSNGDSMLSSEEFMANVPLFAEYDTNGDGVITEEELMN